MVVLFHENVLRASSSCKLFTIPCSHQKTQGAKKPTKKRARGPREAQTRRQREKEAQPRAKGDPRQGRDKRSEAIARHKEHQRQLQRRES